MGETPVDVVVESPLRDTGTEMKVVVAPVRPPDTPPEPFCPPAVLLTGIS